MLISKNWLKKYISNISSLNNEVIADRLTQQLAEVEAIKQVRTDLKDLVCGQILEVKKHPDSDKLSICKVDIGSEKLSIVCGAPNVEKHQKVVVCLPGGKVIDPKNGSYFQIKNTTIRGVASSGMICSEKELGLSDNHETILVLPESTSIGSEIDDLLRDSVFEIENKSLTHRGDCFSHYGIAREIASIFDLELNQMEKPLEPMQTESLPLEIRIETEKVTRFTALTIKNIKVGPSPLWLKIALSAIGIRSVNNVVDVTNYITHDIGQPLHAYDYKKIKDNLLLVRESRKGEKFAAINHENYVLEDGDLVITDGKEIHDLAGIMGGVDSEISEDTTDIIIEAAVFDNDQILKTSRKHGIVTDASIRMSKKVDINRVLYALKTAANAISDLTGGEVASEILDVYPHKYQKKNITFDLQEVPRKVGMSIDSDHILVYLERLGMKITNRKRLDTSANIISAPLEIEVQVPSWRHDITDPIDLVEEVARIHGYDKIAPSKPAIELKGRRLNQIGRFIRRIRKQMLQLGFSETITYSFLSEETKNVMQLEEKHLLKIENAISPELKYVRNSVVPSLLNMYEVNHRNFPELNLFEIGRAVDTYNYTDEKLPAQPWHLGAISTKMYSENDPSQQIESSKEDFLNFKGKVEALIQNLGVPSIQIRWDEVKKNENLFLFNSMHPQRMSTLIVGEERIGIVAEIHPAIMEKVANSQTKAFVTEIDLEKLQDNNLIDNKEFQNPVNLPQITRDLSIVIGAKERIGEVLESAREVFFVKEDSVFVHVSLLDEYFDEDNNRSITIRFNLQPLIKTLNDQEANKLLDEVTQKLRKRHKVKVRES